MANKPFMRTDEEKVFYQELGRYIAAQRMKLGLSQKDLAQDLDVTFQQVQKYETADNRIHAFTLHKLSAKYGISFSSFIDSKLSNGDYRILDADAFRAAIQSIADDLKRLEQVLKFNRRP